MSTDDAFIDAILAAPDDDAPRLVYADALIERGDPQGELIVLQCGKRRAPERERELEVLVRTRLEEQLPNVRITLERGFISKVELGPPALRISWPLLIRQPIRMIGMGYGSVTEIAFAATHPTVDAIRIHNNRKDDFSHGTLDAKLLRTKAPQDSAEGWSRNLPAEQLLDTLLVAQLWNPNATTFERLQSIPTLSDLSLFGPYGLSADEAAQIDQLTSLTRLHVMGWPPGTTTAFLEAAPAPKLRELEVRRHGTDIVSEIAALPQLEAFATNMRLDEAVVREVGASTLRKLALQRPPVVGFERLLATPLANRLEQLELRTGTHRPEQADRLPTLKSLTSLRELELHGFILDEAEARALVADLAHVERVEIRKSNFGGESLSILLAQWPTGRFVWQ